jgi:hypothetical protein
VDIDNAKTKQIIFQFVISKKLHRKYRKIIYNGNYINVTGIVRRHDIIFGEDKLPDRFVIETQTASEYKEKDTIIPDITQFQQLSQPSPQTDTNELLKLPELPNI